MTMKILNYDDYDEDTLFQCTTCDTYFKGDDVIDMDTEGKDLCPSCKKILTMNDIYCMQEDRLKEITSKALISLIELDFDNGIENLDCFSIKEYCSHILEATRDEIEEIIEMNMEEIETVKDWLSNKDE